MARVSGKTDDANLLERLGAAVRAERMARGVSQEAFADAAKIDRSHMGKIERGERNVTILNVVRIAHALDMSVAQLMAQAKL